MLREPAVEEHFFKGFLDGGEGELAVLVFVTLHSPRNIIRACDLRWRGQVATT